MDDSDKQMFHTKGGGGGEGVRNATCLDATETVVKSTPYGLGR